MHRTSPETNDADALRTIAIASAIRQHIEAMGAPKGEWPARRVHRLPRGYANERTTITRESFERAFAEALAILVMPYLSASYEGMRRDALLNGEETSDACPPTIRSSK